MEDLLTEFDKNDSVDPVSLKECERVLSLTLPSGYVSLLRHCNGGEGFIKDGEYLVLWRVEDLLTFNTDYEVNEHCPGLLLFGSSGGGEAYAFDTESSTWPIIRVPFVGMTREAVEPVAETIPEFLERLSVAED